jgi:hypothetical protein
MTQLEFEKQAKRLILAFGPESFNQERLKLIFLKVTDLDSSWFEKLVTTLILNGNQRIDFAELIAAEKAKRKSIELTKNVIEASEQIKSEISENGLSDVLKKFHANSLLDAIQNFKTYKEPKVKND